MIIGSIIIASIMTLVWELTETSIDTNILFGMLFAIWYGVMAVYDEIPKKKKGEIK